MTLFERIGPEGRKILAAAEANAKRMLHDYVGTEHLVASLVEAVTESRDAAVLPAPGALWDEVRVHVGKRPPTREESLPFTDRLREVMGEAGASAQRDGRSSATPADLAQALGEHLNSGAHLVLAAAGADPDDALTVLAEVEPEDLNLRPPGDSAGTAHMARGKSTQSFQSPPSQRRYSLKASWDEAPSRIVNEQGHRATPEETQPAGERDRTRTKPPADAEADADFDAESIELPPSAVLGEGSVLERPAQEALPWLLTVEGHLRWAYRLGALDPGEKIRVESTASLAKAVADIEGVLCTQPPQQLGGWLAIDACASGERLREHLRDAAAGRIDHMGPERCVQLIAEAAETLQRLHERGLTYGAVSPENLVLDRGAKRVLLMSLPILGDGPPLSAPSNSNRYTAPERFVGVLTPAADQFALAIVALEMFNAGTAAALTGPVQAVLDRATRQRPDERFDSLRAFGQALTHAVRQEAPLTASDRLERMRLSWRYALGPAIIFAICGYLVRLLERRPQVNPAVTAIVTPILSGLFAAGLIAALIAIRRRFGFSRGMAGVVSRRRLVLLLILAVPVAGVLIVAQRQSLVQWEPVVFLGWAALAALIGPVTPDSGRWIIARLRRSERRFSRVRNRRTLALFSLTLIASVSLLAWLPGEVTQIWPADSHTLTAADSGALGAIWGFRNGLYAGDYARACSYVDIPTARRHAPCSAWAPFVARLQAGDPIDRPPAGNIFGVAPPNSFLLDYKGNYVHGLTLWELRPRDSPGKYVGSMIAEVPNETLVEVFITRNRPASTSHSASEHAWFYEAQLLDGHFFVRRVDDCVLPAPGAGAGPAQCIFRDENTVAQNAKNEALLRAKAHAASG
jgi:hypothetical protein